MGKARKNKGYVVFQGRIPGVYDSWEECNEQVNGYSGQKQKGYRSRREAQKAWDVWTRAKDSELPRETASGRPQPRRGILNEVAENGVGRSARNSNLKRSNSCVADLSNSSDEDQPAMKKLKSVADEFKANADFVSFESGNEDEDEDEELGPKESPIQLTAAQQAVVDMALRGENIFLTGAAGSGKTATLKEILRRLRVRYGKEKDDAEFPSVQVVAPTGIAALPLNGKTTYSFAGWNTDSFKKPLKELLSSGIRVRVRDAMKKLKVLIIEEISMVENQFLQRLNLLMQRVLESDKSFGGKQVVILGDFHQLPPVKPFEFCFYCGEPMANPEVEPVCTSKNCQAASMPFNLGDKWAFKAPVWKQLQLRHVKLEQIHRQKDTRFQDILNKIRNGVSLRAEEWAALHKRKALPDKAFAIRLMSRLFPVNRFNMAQLNSLKSDPKIWRAFDSSEKLFYTDEDRLYARSNEILRKLEEHKKSLENHRLPTELTLKVGAKVVLLSNLNQTRGLVNGSQGEVIEFADTGNWKKADAEGTKSQRLAAKVDEFQNSKGFWCPIVKFTNGVTSTIFPNAQESLKGTSWDRYRVCRTQIPLTLGWALTIHKSQGMTLNYVEVSSEDIFEPGQMYVGFSRATALEGLTVTGNTVEQLSMDEDVLEFYANSKWEDLGPSNVARPDAAGIKGSMQVEKSTAPDQLAVHASQKVVAYVGTAVVPPCHRMEPEIIVLSDSDDESERG